VRLHLLQLVEYPARLAEQKTLHLGLRQAAGGAYGQPLGPDAQAQRLACRALEVVAHALPVEQAFAVGLWVAQRRRAKQIRLCAHGDHGGEKTES